MRLYYIYINRNILDLEQIDKILKRFTEGLYSTCDTRHLFRYFRSEKNPALMNEAMDNIWEHLQNVERQVDHREQYKQEAYLLLKRINRSDHRFSLYSYWKYAVILILALLTSGGVYFWNRSIQLKNQIYTEIRVKNGEHKKVVLPDGTNVVLNAGSYLKYPVSFMTDTRQVEMDGEAFFEVMRDENRPFVVKTKDITIKVLGTSFNVKAYQADEQLIVSVRTGKVQVDLPEAMMRLFPNEQIVLYKHNGEIQKRNELAGKTISWITNGLYFNRTPIRSVIRELERVYDCKIEFIPGCEFNDYIYGEHDNKSLISVLNSIQYSTGIKYRREDNRILLYK